MTAPLPPAPASCISLAQNLHPRNQLALRGSSTLGTSGIRSPSASPACSSLLALFSLLWSFLIHLFYFADTSEALGRPPRSSVSSSFPAPWSLVVSSLIHLFLNSGIRSFSLSRGRALQQSLFSVLEWLPNFAHDPAAPLAMFPSITKAVEAPTLPADGAGRVCLETEQSIGCRSLSCWGDYLRLNVIRTALRHP